MADCLHCGHSSVEHIPACAHRDVAVRTIRVAESPWRAATRYERSERPCDCASLKVDGYTIHDLIADTCEKYFQDLEKDGYAPNGCDSAELTNRIVQRMNDGV